MQWKDNYEALIIKPKHKIISTNYSNIVNIKNQNQKFLECLTDFYNAFLYIYTYILYLIVFIEREENIFLSLVVIAQWLKHSFTTCIIAFGKIPFGAFSLNLLKRWFTFRKIKISLLKWLCYLNVLNSWSLSNSFLI